MKQVFTEQKDMYGKQVWYATLKTGNSGVGFYGHTEREALDQLEEYLIAKDPQITPERILNSFMSRDNARVNANEPPDQMLLDGWNEYERILSQADAKDAIAIAELEHVIESGTPQPYYGQMMREIACDHTNVKVTDFEGVECCEKCQPERLFPVTTCPDCEGKLEDGTCEWCEHEQCRDGGHLCEDCLGFAIDDAHDRMEACQ